MAQIFLLPINKTVEEGSYPFEYESTKRSVMGKEKNRIQNKNQQTILITSSLDWPFA